MSPDDMLARADHVLVGVIQKHEFDSRPLFRWDLPGEDPANSKCWKILRRGVRVEMVLRGTEARKVIDVYEISGRCGAVGDWNSTHDGERELFLVRVENGRYHVVRDWWRSIFPVTGGPHRRLPLDESRPLWERIALMNWWIERSDDAARITYPHFRYNDPGRALSLWRRIKLIRGLVRHPSASVRVEACGELTSFTGWGLDECWEMLSDQDRADLPEGASSIAAARQEFEKPGASWHWAHRGGREDRRFLTTVSNQRMRSEFCKLYAGEYPGDTDTGCPADRPPPATIVTERGDVPLVGPWPTGQ
jgi:hypothetical protein